MKTPVFFIGERLSGKTRQWLHKQQVQFIEQPFFRTEYKKTNLKFFGTMASRNKQWIVTSSNAAHWLVRFKSKVGVTANDRVYCWSEKQAEILEKLNLQVTVTSYSDYNELAQKVIEINQGEPVVYLTGDSLINEVSTIFSDYLIPFTEVTVFKNKPIDQFVRGLFDAYLFFSPSSIDHFKASGNFTNPVSVVVANENSTARAAWRSFTNKVYLAPEKEEFSFVQFAVSNWKEEDCKPEQTPKWE